MKNAEICGNITTYPASFATENIYGKELLLFGHTKKNDLIAITCLSGCQIVVSQFVNKFKLYYYKCNVILLFGNTIQLCLKQGILASVFW